MKKIILSYRFFSYEFKENSYCNINNSNKLMEIIPLDKISDQIKKDKGVLSDNAIENAASHTNLPFIYYLKEDILFCIRVKNNYVKASSPYVRYSLISALKEFGLDKLYEAYKKGNTKIKDTNIWTQQE